ncbi:MAG: hypothetical protein V5A72_03045, partial [Candidatus Nanohaloarchaea archaeon]
MKKASLIFFLSILIFNGASLEASIVTEDGSTPDLEFDAEDNTSMFFNGFPDGFEQPEQAGSFSFRDNSLVNPNLFLNLTGDGSDIEGEEIQIYYASPSGNTSISLMPETIYISEFNGSSKLIDIDLSAFDALYPGKMFVGIAEEEVSFEKPLNESTNITETVTETRGPFNLTEINSSIMDGNYTVYPSIQSVKDQTLIKVKNIYDSQDNLIHHNRKFQKSAIMTIERQDKVLDSKKISPGSIEGFNFSFKGGEEVYVNGILSLKTKGVSECETIDNEDFYYIINSSTFNSDNKSCIEVSNVTDTVVDFANTTVDGDGNASMSNGSCAININNTRGISLKDPRVQEYDRGICISNSQDTLIQGEASRENNLGIYMSNSTSEIREISLKNENAEIEAEENSSANLTGVKFETADITALANDVRMKNVFEPPPDPDWAINITQWINVTKTDEAGNVKDLGFNYQPLSETDINPLYMLKYDLVRNSSSNTTNETELDWTYENLSINKDPAERIIVKPGKLEEFSIFGVYGERVEGNGTGDTPGEGAGDNPDGTGSLGGSET